MPVKIIQAAQVPEYDMKGIAIDLNRKTGVLIRQSKKGADLDSRESRLRQESLIPVATTLRQESDSSNIILYDEGSGVSGTKGYDQRPQLSRLYLDIANGVIGSIVVARADRLFRDKHFRNVSMFTEIAEKQKIILIVPGRAVYDFTKTRDLQAFQREMQEAYNYIATQIAYMQDTRMQKLQRGFYGGSNLPAPYAIERSAAREVQIPVIYRPWNPIAIDLFEQFTQFDFMLTRIARYIDEQGCIFPYPSAEDIQRYMFKTRMRTVAGGYTFSSAASIRHYFSNLTLIGYAKIGRDEEGNSLVLADAFEPALPMELFRDSYASITGYYPDGAPYKRSRVFARGKSTPREDSSALLRGLLISSDGNVTYNLRKDIPFYCCFKGITTTEQVVRYRVGIMQQQRAWSVPTEELDRTVVSRLSALASHDSHISERVKAFWDQRKSDEVSGAKLLRMQIEKADAQIQRLDQLLTAPATPLSPETEARYIGLLHEAEADLQRLLKRQSEHNEDTNPDEIIADFYQILAQLPNEYKHLSPAKQKQLIRQVIREIKLNILSPHLFVLHIKWQSAIARIPDVAVIWRGMAPNNGGTWTPEEDAQMHRLYPCAPQIEIMRVSPRHSWNRIVEHAQELGIRRTISHHGPHPFNIYHRTVSFQDLDAISRLASAPKHQERLREIVNELARKTVSGGLSAYWWFSEDNVSYVRNLTAPPEIPAPILLLDRESTEDGWRHPGE